MTSEAQVGSVSKIECLATFRGGAEAKLALYRHLSPLSVNAILRALPIDSRVNLQPAMRCLFTPLVVGVEKAKTTFARGDIALLAAGGLLCVFVKDARSDRPLNPLGAVGEGLELFDAIKTGDTVRISASPQAQAGQSGGASVH